MNNAKLIFTRFLASTRSNVPFAWIIVLALMPWLAIAIAVTLSLNGHAEERTSTGSGRSLTDGKVNESGAAGVTWNTTATPAPVSQPFTTQIPYQPPSQITSFAPGVQQPTQSPMPAYTNASMNSPEQPPDSVLMSRSMTQAETGDLRGAYSTASAIQNESLRMTMLRTISQSMTQQANRTGPQRTLQPTERSSINIEGVHSMSARAMQAIATARNGNIETGLQMAYSIRDDYTRGAVLGELAQIQSESEDLSAATDMLNRMIEAAQGIRDPQLQASTLRQIASALAVIEGRINRNAATWVLESGGRLMLLGSKEWITSVEELPENASNIRIVHIDLSGTQVSDSALTRLRGQNDLIGLNLWGTPATDAALAHLQHTPNLTFLYLDNTGVSDNGLRRLKDLQRMTELSLSGTNVSDAGLAYIVGMKNLRVLRLESSRITDSGLALMKNLVHLNKLSLAGPRITDSGLSHLKELSSLSELRLSGTRTTEAAIKELKKALPDCEIVRQSTFLGSREPKFSP